ncbi:MAG: ribonuclease PH [Vampirovibrionales bacterium]|nr:ribonuclease PH [Vampirovibrionales bacterium]
MPDLEQTDFTRPDNRAPHELRPIEIIRNYTKHAPGSVLVAFGDTRVLVTASIEERVPRHIHQLGLETHGWVTAEYSMLPAATQQRTQRERQKIGGRTNEIQRLIGRCLRASVAMEKLGNRTFTIDADVLQADGGTRVAAITGGFVALVDAMKHLQNEGLMGEDLPILSPIAAVSVGIVQGNELLDLNYEEDSTADVDANVIMNAKGEIIELQASSERMPFTRQSLDKLVDLAHGGISQLINLQLEALNLAQPV